LLENVKDPKTLTIINFLTLIHMYQYTIFNDQEDKKGKIFRIKILFEFQQ
jgi:hypothetical protein